MDFNLSDIILQCPSWLYWKDLEGKYLGCTQVMAESLGLSSPEKIVGRSDADFFIPSEVKTASFNEQSVIDSGHSKTVQETRTPFQGKEMTFLRQISLLKDKRNQVMGILSSMVDITNIQFPPQNENTVSTAICLESIINHIPGSVYWKDRKGAYLGCNDYVAKMAGVSSPQELIGKTDYQLLWKDTADKLYQTDQSIMNTGKEKTLEETSKIADGSRIILLTTKTPLFNEGGEVIGILGVSVDITQRKRLEEESLANRSKEQLLNAINHLIRSPLNSALGMTQLLKKHAQSSEQKADLSIIEDSVKKIVPILDRVGYYLDLDRGEIKLSKHQFFLKHTIEGIIQSYLPTATEKRTKISLSYDEKLPTQFIGDAFFTHAILNTLIHNAVRFTNRGKIQIQVKFFNKTHSEWQVEMLVQDTGCGIPLPQCQYLFSMFDLVPSSAEEVFTQSGLTLSITQKIVTMLGGKMEVASQVGRGSIFRVLLPYEDIGQRRLLKELEAEITHSDVTNHEIANEKIHYKGRSIQILLVEDDFISMTVLKRMLEENFDCDITITLTLSDALKGLEKSYDLILTDVNLPDGNGGTIAEKVRELYDNPPPVIAITAHVSESEREMLGRQGVTDIAAKPVTLDTLSDIVKYYVFGEE